MKNNLITLTATQQNVLETIKNQRSYGIFLDMGVGKNSTRFIFN